MIKRLRASFLGIRTFHGCSHCVWIGDGFPPKVSIASRLYSLRNFVIARNDVRNDSDSWLRHEIFPSRIYKGRNIPDRTITKFIQIIGQQAELAGISEADIKAVVKVLEQKRVGVRNK